MQGTQQQRDDSNGFAEVINEGVQANEAMVLTPEIRAEVDIQISTAKRYPRSIKAFKQQALDMATFDEETASGCFYSLPRGGKPIEGPSARLAEIVLSAWGNVRADAKVVGHDGKEITAEAMTWDLEKNVAIRVQVKRRITDKQGNTFSADMITVTGNAACSIALRNSVFKVIPMVYTKAIYGAARQVAIGDISTLEAKRAEAVAYFGKMGIVPARVFAAIGKLSIEDVGLDEVATLKGLATAIKDGDVSIDDAFPSIVTEGPTGVSGLKDRLKKEPAPAAETPTVAPEPETEPEGVETPIPSIHTEPEDTDAGAEAALQESEEDEADETAADPQESTLQSLIDSAKDRVREITGGKTRETTDILNGRRLDSMDAKAIKAFHKELDKIEAAA